MPRSLFPVDRIMDMKPQEYLLYLLVQRRAAHLWISLNRTDKANALTVPMMEAAALALAKAVGEDSLRAVLLTGAGERVFSGGVDVREQPADGDMLAHRERRSSALFALLDALIDCPKPVIAVLNGAASGGGAMLALVADARVAVDTAAISLPEINLGMPTFAAASIVLEIGGLALATDLVQSGRQMTAGEALTRGLVSAIVPRADLEGAATRIAQTFATKNPQAFAANKHWLNRGIKAALAQARTASVEHRGKASQL